MKTPKLYIPVELYGVCVKKQVLNELDLKIANICHRKESLTVPEWLQAPRKKRKVFIWIMLAEILENLSFNGVAWHGNLTRRILSSNF